MYCTVLYLLYCTVLLYSTVLYCVAIPATSNCCYHSNYYCTVQYCVPYCTVYCTVLCTVLYCIVLYYCTVCLSCYHSNCYNTILYCIVLCCILYCIVVAITATNLVLWVIYTTLRYNNVSYCSRPCLLEWSFASRAVVHICYRLASEKVLRDWVFQSTSSWHHHLVLGSPQMCCPATVYRPH